MLRMLILGLCLALVAGCGGRERRAADVPLYQGESPELRALINTYADRYEVPRELVHRVVQRESRYTPGARNGPYMGLMQIHPTTARTMGHRGPPESLLDAETNLRYAVKSTPWPNVDLIPSNLELFDVEYELAAAGSDGGSVLAARFRKLRAGLAELASDYDMVILDPPPALGTISLAVMQAANALLVPLAATTPDFCSTVQFLSMMDQVLHQLGEAGIEVGYDFVRLICSKFDGNDPSHAMVRQIMEQTFGPSLLPVSILESAEISHAAMRMMTVYELERPLGTARTHKRCRANMDEALGQVEQLIRRGWGRVAPASEEDVVNEAA